MSENTVSSTDVAVLDTDNTGSAVAVEIANISKGNLSFFSSIQGNNFESKIATLEAMSNSVPIKENLRKTINVQNIILQTVSMADRRTGEVRDQPRIILIDADGTAYHAISAGLYTSIKNMLGVAGHPATWNAPIAIHIVEEKGREGDYYTVKFGEAPKK